MKAGFSDDIRILLVFLKVEDTHMLSEQCYQAVSKNLECGPEF